MIDKSNGNATIDQLIQHSDFLSQTIFQHAQGLISDSRLYQLIGHDKYNERQFVNRHWWHERKHFRNSGSVCPSATLRTKLTARSLMDICESKQYKFDQSKIDFTTNLFAIHLDIIDNVFADILAVVYWYRGKHVLRTFDMTCDPSISTKPMLAYGQYANQFRVANYRAKFDALCQKWNSTVRMVDCNGAVYNSTYGMDNNLAINLICADHVGSIYRIDPFTAGQQIMRDRDEFDLVISLCRKHVRAHGDDISYTLLSSHDFVK